jgi:hypothetical protein
MSEGARCGSAESRPLQRFEARRSMAIRGLDMPPRRGEAEISEGPWGRGSWGRTLEKAARSAQRTIY